MKRKKSLELTQELWKSKQYGQRG